MPKPFKKRRTPRSFQSNTLLTSKGTLHYEYQYSKEGDFLVAWKVSYQDPRKTAKISLHDSCPKSMHVPVFFFPCLLEGKAWWLDGWTDTTVFRAKQRDSGVPEMKSKKHGEKCPFIQTPCNDILQIPVRALLAVTHVFLFLEQGTAKNINGLTRPDTSTWFQHPNCPVFLSAWNARKHDMLRRFMQRQDASDLNVPGDQVKGVDHGGSITPWAAVINAVSSERDWSAQAWPVRGCWFQSSSCKTSLSPTNSSASFHSWNKSDLLGYDCFGRVILPTTVRPVQTHTRTYFF